MTSREQILAKIKTNKPAFKPQPGLFEFEHSENEAIDFINFQKTAKDLHTTVIEANGYDDIATHINTWHSAHPGKILNAVPQLAYSNSTIKNAHELEDVMLSIIEGKIGVAENGAIWVEEANIIHRVVPFICQHLAIILKKTAIVSNMHLAYNKINGYKHGFGVFISGPSKTADIEQSLVIGAHGPRTLTIYLV